MLSATCFALPTAARQSSQVQRAALARAATDEGFRQNDGQRLSPLLHAGQKPSFDTCFASFAEAAGSLLGAAKHD